MDPFRWIKEHTSGLFREVSEFLCVLWNIWLARNVFVFQHVDWPLQVTISKGLLLGKHTYESLGLEAKDLPKDGVFYVRWTPLPMGWVKLNTD